MLRITELRLPLDHAPDALRPAIAARLGIDEVDLLGFTVFRRNYDARRKTAIVLIYTIDCEVAGEAAVLARLADDRHVRPAPDTRYRLVAQAPADFCASQRPRPVVIGFGPCGIFAALVLAQMGLCPIVLERGKAVRERTKDTWGLWRKSVLNPESNVQFGEGGAGTFSDGKLWSQISDPRHLTRKVLEEFVKAGAPEEILYVGKPHIGTFRLVSMVEKMRAEILALGGDIRFGQKVVDLLVEDAPGGERAAGAAPGGGARRQVRGLVLAGGEQIRTDHVVLALGHSARDTFAMLHSRGVYMEAKPFSVGFRIEHPQSLIDRARFGPNAGNPILGAADYRLVHHAKNGRSVYSFCMCPGGTVVAATSEPERVVTNGMSQYSRAERNANAGIVVGISPQDYRQDRGASGPVSPLDGIAFQRFWESRAYALGGGAYHAPGQLVGDFVAGRHGKAVTREFGSVLPSYKPGVTLTDLAEPGNESLPAEVLAAIREALPAFERQIPGFAMADAVLTGVETRTSSPLRITRGKDYQSLNVAGLYPAGEGAGYAGGIMSAGVDGIEVAEALGARMIAGGSG
ncbi:NAD(P)/FAD-dependent oxidoreductase [Burkholderiaceae bacterium FT117]|uniref:NAD(P)/FAD-dependent oxidoreductase n=1 Tax=Zeimonas sediminis TaxID=2944268 RepID=UPI002342F80C|nr:NAD(P)/FAD-dependent oxidoreductase [Zeimonas sediminis]MCM5570563.1 NAD(P)/FAD-dependent oxidoreductase [Zeimonas sediminis]